MAGSSAAPRERIIDRCHPRPSWAVGLVFVLSPGAPVPSNHAVVELVFASSSSDAEAWGLFMLVQILRLTRVLID
jgi:hypothetical protein